MNDPQFVEAGRILAERMQKEGGRIVADQITYGFRALTGRRPSEREIDVFSSLYKDELTRFEASPKRAIEVLSVGERPRDKQLDLSKTAALAIVANTIINHDEAYTKR